MWYFGFKFREEHNGSHEHVAAPAIGTCNTSGRLLRLSAHHRIPRYNRVHDMSTADSRNGGLMEENDELDPDCNFAVDELDADDTTSSSGTRSESGSGTEQEQVSSPDRSPDAVNATTRDDDGLQEFADEELLSASSDTDTADSSSSETDSSDEASDGLAPALPVPCEVGHNSFPPALPYPADPNCPLSPPMVDWQVLPALTNDRLARLPGANTELSATQAPAACVHQQLERGNAVQLHAPEAHKHAAQATNTTGAAGVASHTNHIPDACSNQAAAAAAPAPSQPPGESFMQQLLGPEGMQQHAFPTYTSAGTTTQGEQQRPPPLLSLPAPASVYNTRA
ncbi:hypothetical protein QJQ45_009133, partial [Haematococcus lacustris]